MSRRRARSAPTRPTGSPTRCDSRHLPDGPPTTRTRTPSIKERGSHSRVSWNTVAQLQLTPQLKRTRNPERERPIRVREEQVTNQLGPLRTVSADQELILIAMPHLGRRRRSRAVPERRSIEQRSRNSGTDSSSGCPIGVFEALIARRVRATIVRIHTTTHPRRRVRVQPGRVGVRDRVGCAVDVGLPRRRHERVDGDELACAGSWYRLLRNKTPRRSFWRGGLVRDGRDLEQRPFRLGRRPVETGCSEPENRGTALSGAFTIVGTFASIAGSTGAAVTTHPRPWGRPSDARSRPMQR